MKRREDNLKMSASRRRRRTRGAAASDAQNEPGGAYQDRFVPRHESTKRREG